MDELTFRIAYGILSAVIICALIFLLSRGLNRAHYLRPVLIGFILASLFVWGFGVVVEFGLLIGGCAVGYLSARWILGWRKHLRVGGLAGMLFMPNISFAIAYHEFKEFAKYGGYSLTDFGSGFLAQISISTLIYAFVFITFAGVGAILGGFLRRALKPSELKPSVSQQ
jgi:MFS family permease